jgi:membrane protein implicated in regulation of membrane protease activity
MRWLKSIAREVFGLFVDDGIFAVAILAWLALAVVVLPRAGLWTRVAGPVLFAGLALILIESALRFSRRRTKKRRPAKS